MSMKVAMIFMVALVSLTMSKEIFAQQYYYGQQKSPVQYGHPQTGNNCRPNNQGLNQQGFRPLRNLAQGIRRLGLGRNWISMGRVPHDSTQRKIGKAVAKFYNRGSVCTATMITPHHAMLNRHCVSRYLNATLTFNYEDGIPSSQRRRYRCNKLVMTDSSLDMAIIQCEGAPGNTWGIAELERGVPPAGTKSFTVHHPGGRPKKYSEGTFGKYRGRSRSYISNNIAGGSSGSATFDANTGKIIMLNNSRKVWWGAPSATQGMGHSSAYIVRAIERRLGKNFLPTFHRNQQQPQQQQAPKQNIPQIAGNNGGAQNNRPMIQGYNNQGHQAPKQITPNRKFIANYNQGAYTRPNTPKVQQQVTPKVVPQVRPQINKSLNLKRSVSSGVFSKSKANYLNQSALSAPKVAGNNIAGRSITLNEGKRKIRFHEAGPSTNNIRPQVQSAPPAVNNGGYKPQVNNGGYTPQINNGGLQQGQNNGGAGAPSIPNQPSKISGGQLMQKLTLAAQRVRSRQGFSSYAQYRQSGYQGDLADTGVQLSSIPLQPVNAKRHNPRYGSLHREVFSQRGRNDTEYYYVSDGRGTRRVHESREVPHTQTHEGTHGVNSRIRNMADGWIRQAGLKSAIRVDGFYVGNNTAVVLQLPKINMRDIAAHVPSSLKRDSMYRTYVSNNLREISEREQMRTRMNNHFNNPTQFMDEMTAYNNGTVTQIEASANGAAPLSNGTLRNTVFMFMFNLSTLAATASRDPDYFAREPQYRHLLAHEIVRMNKNIQYYEQRGKGHRDIGYLFQQLRQSNDPNWARMRNYTRDLLGPKWARQNLGI